MILAIEVNNYRPLIIKSVRDMVGAQLDHMMNDIVQDVLLSALEHIANEGAVQVNWLQTRAGWMARDRIKEANAELSLDNLLDDGVDGTVESLPASLIDLETPEGLYAVREFIENLSDEDREIMEMLSEGQGQQQIAEELGVDQATISRRIEGMRERLK